MSTVKSLLLNVDSSDPLSIVELGIDLILPPVVGVYAAEINRAPHLVCIELIRAPVLVSIPRGWVVDAVE